jgi:hypothetical protein
VEGALLNSGEKHLDPGNCERCGINCEPGRIAPIIGGIKANLSGIKEKPGGIV